MNTKILWTVIVLLMIINIAAYIKAGSLKETVREPMTQVPVSSVVKVKPVRTVMPEPLPSARAGYTIAQTAVFSEPMVHGEPYATLAPHSDVNLLDEADGWCRILIGEEVYFVSADCVRAKRESNGFLVCVDPGHQKRANLEKEPIGPNSSTKKAKVTAGTSGVKSRLREHELNLLVGLKLQIELENRGYEVLMTRTTADVNISNAERAVMANEANADAFIRIHANGAENKSWEGAATLYQKENNKYNGHLYEKSKALSVYVLDELVAATGCVKLAARETNTMSGINWSQVPVTLIEMGYMSNPEEDLLMASEDYQYKLAVGIANGIDLFLLGDKSDTQ